MTTLDIKNNMNNGHAMNTIPNQFVRIYTGLTCNNLPTCVKKRWYTVVKWIHKKKITKNILKATLNAIYDDIVEI